MLVYLCDGNMKYHTPLTRVSLALNCFPASCIGSTYIQRHSTILISVEVQDHLNIYPVFSS